MSNVRRELADRIREALPELDREGAKAVEIYNKGLRMSEDQDVYLGAAAMCIHGYYTGLEKLFLQIARRLGEATPAGEESHKQLLEQMARPADGLRPAIIQMDTLEALDEIRRFRHLVRNIYVMNLDPVRMA